MNCLHTYGPKIDYKDITDILCDEKGHETHFYGQREEKPCPLISVMNLSKILCQGYIDYWCQGIDIQKREKQQRIFLYLL